MVKAGKTHLADSGTKNGVKTANNNGIEVTTAKRRQSSKYKAKNGRLQAGAVKNIAMLMLAITVRHLGPTYSITEKKK